MGNADSNITSAIKKQTDSESVKIYSLIDVKGGGELVAVMKEAASNPSSNLDLEDRIRELVEPFLYDKGAGRKVPISKLVLTRNKDRPKNKQLTPPSPSEASEAQGPWREVCWDLDQRGSVGETALHLCFLVYAPLHMKLAKHLVKLFPKLINDVYQGEEYYGENVLHMAIGNEDPFMAKFLLNHGANFEERACGNFFCPEDQKAGRTDSLDHEWVDLPLRTNYEGYVYTGEYPLSFAARLNQEECYRLLLAKGACPDRQDANGNTLVHILVIQDNIEMLDVAFDLGASLTIKNRQGFTPLGLAAKLARKRMFFHLLDIQRDIYWEMGNITCTAYPLQGVDTTDCSTGEIDRLSVLNVVAYGEHPDHLDMLDGLLIDLLNAKWNTYIKFRFYRQFLTFFSYFVCSLVCFISRPRPVTIPCLLRNSTADPCYLMLSGEIQVRWGFEILSVGGAFLYLLDAAREARFLGYHIFIENLMTVPSRVLFLFSSLVLMVMVPLRLTCSHQEEDVAAVIVMLTTAPYFLFFCRGFKIVGPFVVMIYKMIVTDLLCFTIIYMVFVLGFSQAYYVLFRSYTGEKASFFADPLQSILTMFVMSLSEFGDAYDQFQYTEHEGLAKSLFIVYMILVTTLLINMLIAMMGKTYQDIAERHNEWLRQWARIVLVVERGVSPQECLLQQCNYSHETAGSDRKLVRRLEHNEEEKEELRRIEEMKASNMQLRKKWEFSL